MNPDTDRPSQQGTPAPPTAQMPTPADVATRVLGHAESGMLAEASERIGPYKLLEKLGEGGFGERAVAQRPAVAARVAQDQSRQSGFLASQSSQVLGRYRIVDLWKRTADQQRAFLPVVAQEARSGHAERPAGIRLQFNSRSRHQRVAASNRLRAPA